MSLSREEIIYEAIDATVQDNGAKWEEIVEAIISTGLEIKNWMEVRGVLQYLLDEGEIARTDSVFKEIYYRIIK